jgi:hypothetical protein
VHDSRFIFKGEDIKNVSGVDITVGGDHGKERFRMIFF